MGLFSFFKKAGSKALVKEEEKAAESSLAKEIAKKAKISVFHSMVKAMKLDIEDLEIDLDDDVVIVSGTTDSHETREKLILTLGNVEGIATVDDRISVVTPPPTSQFYTVQKGDSLSKIAKEFYGDAMKYKMIFEANQPMLDDPNKIYPGQSLRIPNLQA